MTSLIPASTRNIIMDSTSSDNVPHKEEIPHVVLGFCSYLDGRFELIVSRDADEFAPYATVTLKGRLEQGQFEKIAKMGIPTCVHFKARIPKGGKDKWLKKQWRKQSPKRKKSAVTDGAANPKSQSSKLS